MERAHHIEKVADEGMPIVGYQAIAQVLSEQLADAQATIAALQAQLKYLCRFIWGEEGTFTFPDGDTIDIRKGQSREQLEQQLTQRTAELEATEKAYQDKTRLYIEQTGAVADLQAELERVRAASNEDNKTGQMMLDDAIRERNELRTLIAALPKVEGEITVSHGYVKDSTRCHALFGADEDAASYAALLQHRQGME